MAKKKYGVTVPITGYVYKEVEVDENATEEEIVNEAFETVTDENLEEWEMTEHICEGNTFCGMINDYEIEELEEEE